MVTTPKIGKETVGIPKLHFAIVSNNNLGKELEDSGHIPLKVMHAQTKTDWLCNPITNN